MTSEKIYIGTRLHKHEVDYIDKLRGKRISRTAAVRELTLTAIKMRHQFNPIHGECFSCNLPRESLIHFSSYELAVMRLK